MPRPVAPPGDKNKSTGPNAPELSPEQIQAKIDRDRALWNKHANELRDDALKVLEIVKTKNADALFQAGSDIDSACENCHLEYLVPGRQESRPRRRGQARHIRPCEEKAGAALTVRVDRRHDDAHPVTKGDRCPSGCPWFSSSRP